MTKRPAQLRLDLAAGSCMIAMTLVAYWSVIAPARESRAMATTNATRLGSEQLRVSQLSNTLAALHTQRESASRSVSAAQPELIPVSELNGRLATLTDLAAHDKIQIDSIEPGERAAKTATFVVTTIALNARGSYRNCERFMAALHEKMRDITVLSFDLTSPVADDTATLNLRLMWYASADASPAMSSQAKLAQGTR